MNYGVNLNDTVLEKYIFKVFPFNIAEALWETR